MRVSSNSLGGKPIEGPTEGATPWPLFELAVSIEVGPTVLAPRQEVSVRSIRRSLTILVLGREGRHRHSPRQTRALLGVWVYWEARDCCPHCHSFDKPRDRLSEVCVRRPSETRTPNLSLSFSVTFFIFRLSLGFSRNKRVGQGGKLHISWTTNIVPRLKKKLSWLKI